MRRILILLSVFIAVAAQAQTKYNCITGNAGGGPFGAGYQTFPDGNTVSIYRGGGGPGCFSGEYLGYPANYPAAPDTFGTGHNFSGGQSPFGNCGIGAYYIGRRGCDNSWSFWFANPVTDVRIRMVSLNDSDTVRLTIPSGSMAPPTTIPVTASMMSAWTSACGGGFFAVPGVNGRLSSTQPQTGGASTVQLDVQNPFPPYTLPRISVGSQTKFSSNNDGVVFEICYKDDSCSLRFEVRADSPRCTGRPINLHVANYPNTTHYWRNIPTGPAGAWSASGLGLANPVIPNANLFHTGLYIDSARRGACVYIDTLNIPSIDNTPAKPTVTFTGPKCPGEDDTVTAKTGLPAGGSYYFYANVPSGSVFYVPPNGGNEYRLPKISALDAGTYFVYAQTPQGCVSDTANIAVTVNQPVEASFKGDYGLGCKGDTLFFSNFSFGSNLFTWDFGDQTPPVPVVSTQPDTMHIYHHPTMPISYNVKLTVGNGICKDDTTIAFTFDHFLKAVFTASDDSICQNENIDFVNSSQFAGGTIPVYVWNFGDGATDDGVLGTSHFYTRVGVYDVTLEITDYLGCKDTAHNLLVVDSSGSIYFESDDNAVCAGQVINFFGAYSPYGINNAIWDFKDGNLLYNKPNVQHAYDEAGNYKVSFFADYRVCKDTTYYIDLVVKPYPIVDLGADTTICPNGEPVLISDVINKGNPNIKWKWNNIVKDEGSDIMVYHPGTYSVTADLNGCTTTDSIRVFKKCYLDVPNVFTPNGDGSNDYFLPRELLSRGVSKFNMSIFNRWGGVVFKTDVINGRGWDGKFNGENEPNGVYVYLIDVTFVNGTSEKYQGNVTLLR